MIDNRVIDQTSFGSDDVLSVAISFIGEFGEIATLPYDIASSVNDMAEGMALKNFILSLSDTRDRLTNEYDNLHYNAVIISGTEFPDKPHVSVFDDSGQQVE